MQDDRSINAREGPVQRVAQTIASQPQVPPANPVLAQQFSKLLAQTPHAKDAYPEPEREAQSPGWDSLKQRAFRCAEKLVAADSTEQRDEEANSDGDTGETPETASEKVTEDTVSILSERRLARLIKVNVGLFGDSAAGDLANTLAESVRWGQHFGQTWRIEILLSSADIPTIHLYMHSDEAALHLRFVCQDLRTRRILEKNMLLLRARLIAASAKPVVLEVEYAADDNVSPPASGETP
jgi:hypothetical protein